MITTTCKAVTKSTVGFIATLLMVICYFTEAFAAIATVASIGLAIVDADFAPIVFTVLAIIVGGAAYFLENALLNFSLKWDCP